MNATKRKFNALIQGISARSSPAGPANDSDKAQSTRTSNSSLSSATMALDAELLAKRRRLGFGTTPVAGNSTTNGSHNGVPAISNIVLRKWSADSNPKKSTEAAKYSPSDRGELLKRLATFQELTDWTPKPNAVSEVEWAKHGWICNGKERVRCTLCHKELVVGLNRKEVDGKEISVLVPSEIGTSLGHSGDSNHNH
jgi:C3HC zinc finger-like